MKTLKVCEICQNEAPRSEVFVDQPCNSVGATLLLERKNSWLMVSLQISALGWSSISFFTSSDRYPVPSRSGFLPVAL